MDIKNIDSSAGKMPQLTENRNFGRSVRRSRAIAVIIAFVIMLCCSCADQSESAENNSSETAAANADINADINTDISDIGRAVGDTLSQADVIEFIIDDDPSEETEVEISYDLEELTSQINTALDSYYGTWSVYVKELKSGDSISINNRQMYAASEIKLYAMAAAYQQISEGLLSEDGVYDIIYDMITESSNYDFNSMVWYMGKYYITDWCDEHGYYDTYQCHGLYPADNADGLQTYYGENMTTVEDMGRLLESIYKGECVSEEYSQKMIDIMLDQTLCNKIPSGIPAGVKVANKTGETENVCHDAAIVYSDNADYILTVMVYAPGSAWSCSDDVADLSELVYDFFNET